MNEVRKGYTLEETLKYGKKYLQQQNIEEYEVDAYLLLAFVFKITRNYYYLNSKDEVASSDYERYIECIKQRGEKIPLQYITKEQEFMGLSFYVTKDVLIPRFDTEILVEEVLKESKGKDILDVCTGSGCIIISLSKLGDISSGTGLDISTNALKVASYNKEQLKADVTLIESDLFTEIEKKYDIIVSNPPYIPTKDIDVLMDEVKVHEPFIALDGKEDGLYFYDKIIKELPNYLKDGGKIFFEIGYDQGEAVSLLLENMKFEEIEVIKDLAKNDRVVKATYRNHLEHHT